MKRTGTATLWLTEGSVPHFREMVELGREIMRALCEQVGNEETVRRFADPFWLSSLACALGFEWNTSGQTTVTLKALSHGLVGTDIPVRVLGGKGAEMRSAQLEAGKLLAEIGVREVGEIRRAMRLTTSVDNAALQDSYDIYFHAAIVSESGQWVIINQGMNTDNKTARRYHWSSDRGLGVVEPHTEILSEAVEDVVLDLTSTASAETCQTILEMLEDTPPSRLNQDLAQIKAIARKQHTLTDSFEDLPTIPTHLSPPNRFDEETIRRAKNVSSFDELLTTQGVGAATIRGLAYIAALIYGSKVSWRDPVKFSYAFGTKSGKPYPVNKAAMLEAAEFIKQAVMASKMGDETKLMVLRRLNSLLESNH
ncbi:MAG: DUF763 domain-containing protein [Candidatus Caldarchaeum sp.]